MVPSKLRQTKTAAVAPTALGLKWAEPWTTGVAPIARSRSWSWRSEHHETVTSIWTWITKLTRRRGVGLHQKSIQRKWNMAIANTLMRAATFAVLRAMERGMRTERGPTKKGEQSGLREAAAKDEMKTEEKMGHDLAKGADRFDERSKSSDGRSAASKQKG